MSNMEEQTLCVTSGARSDPLFWSESRGGCQLSKTWQCSCFRQLSYVTLPCLQFCQPKDPRAVIIMRIDVGVVESNENGMERIMTDRIRADVCLILLIAIVSKLSFDHFVFVHSPQSLVFEFNKK